MSTTRLCPAPEPTGVSNDARPPLSLERGKEEVEEVDEEDEVLAERRAGRKQLHSGLVANDDDDDASLPVSDLLPLEALPPAPSDSQGPQWPTNLDSELTSLGKSH